MQTERTSQELAAPHLHMTAERSAEFVRNGGVLLALVLGTT